MALGKRALLSLVVCLSVHSHVEGGSPTRMLNAKPKQAQLQPAAPELGRLRGTSGIPPPVSVANSTYTAMHAVGQKAAMPCQCDLSQQGWLPTRRTTPKCIFIDLGAANGNTLQDFVDGKYGPVKDCPSGGKWEATLVEANPRFNAPLKQAEVTWAGLVHANTATAAYMCEAKTTFYLDTTSVEHNYWGSSMSANHVDTKKSGHQAVTVPTVNVMKVLYETTIPSDYVILKMDIEGAEWDVLPCLSKSATAHLVDRLLVEVHPQDWGNAGTTQEGLDAAFTALRAQGVDIPGNYHSQTL